ncbi:ATP synthase F0 subcomplex B subunit [Georgenia satyanarayanai]|uniref:ATP synthase subunit b n=1 Tax=Georgenia satyanarayanai TaxID=860221 RepID=A0A2Y9A650_9MICO|nr:F0F1 ATP synthase subunit B [Georgenia satyanarayanai]PYG00512.1 ATP synthase F0 subcomplex B subunit [Georgenia satyanarayanai]SSA39901.1 ATP synthase F0 subcomplex B subunit [Georgenia satyanarayanai]
MLSTALVRAAEEGGQNPLIPADYDIIWSALCIAVIAFFFVKLILPVFTRILDERTEKIEGGLKAGENARAEAEELRSEIERELTEARVEAARVREQAQEDAKVIAADVRAQARTDAERIVESAHRQIEAERQQAAASLRTDIGALATTLAERIVGESLADEQRRQRVIDRFLDELDAQTELVPGGEKVGGATEA